MADFSQRFSPAEQFPYYYSDDPTYAGMQAGTREQALKNLAAMLAADQNGLPGATALNGQGAIRVPPISGPQRPAPQQPMIPIQTAQGAPQTPGQSMQTAPNSGVVGQSPYSNQALTGGSGMPIGGLPTQSPAPNFNSPQQVEPQQMQQPPISGPANPQFRMQQHQQNMQNFAKLLASLHGYNFLNQYLGQA